MIKTNIFLLSFLFLFLNEYLCSKELFLNNNINSNDEYEAILDEKLTGFESELNDIYKRSLIYDREGLLENSQEKWLMYRNTYVNYIVERKKIIGSNSRQVYLKSMIKITKLRLDELKTIFVSNYSDDIDERIFFEDLKITIPEISDKYINQTLTDTKLDSFNIDYRFFKRIRKKYSNDQVKIENMIYQLPKNTYRYITQLINQSFIKNPEKYADRFSGVNKENCNEKVNFYLGLNPISNTTNKEIFDLWSLGVSVGLRPSGKSFNIINLIISSGGEILYGLDQNPYYWQKGKVKKDRNSILIDIIMAPNGKPVYGKGIITVYTYDLRNKEFLISKRSSDIIDLNKYWNWGK